MFSITIGQGWWRPMLCTDKRVKKVTYGGVFDLALNSHSCSENYTKTKN